MKKPGSPSTKAADKPNGAVSTHTVTVMATETKTPKTPDKKPKPSSRVTNASVQQPRPLPSVRHEVPQSGSPKMSRPTHGRPEAAVTPMQLEGSPRLSGQLSFSDSAPRRSGQLSPLEPPTDTVSKKKKKKKKSRKSQEYGEGD